MKRICDWSESDWRLAALTASALAGGIAGFVVGVIRRTVEYSMNIAYVEGREAARLEVSCGTDQGSKRQKDPQEAGSTKCADEDQTGADSPAGADGTGPGGETGVGAGPAAAR